MSGPEVPFPPKDEADRATAEKFGFCRDCPFPSSHEPKIIELSGGKLHRELGAGSYHASEIAGVVTIVATGMAPNLNTKVQLIQLPLMIWPPRFALHFTNPEVVLPSTHPFKVEATLQTHQRLKAIQIQDRDGVHAVPVENF